ncbi:MAG: hypothetical protein U1A72_03440 [Sulfuritalea sp.]|nr:hypothetical protein [Sulfuritalea sp.]
MQLTAKLKEQVIKAVRTSMRIEGYVPARSREVKAQVKALMEKWRVQVSIPGK